MIVLALAFSACSGRAADGQAGASAPSPPAFQPPVRFAGTPTGRLAQASSPCGPIASPRAGALTNSYRFVPRLWGKYGAPRQPLAKNAPAPGVYETAPYTCMVIVPGAHPDDSSVHWSGAGPSRMPVVKPELRFIPRAAK